MGEGGKRGAEKNNTWTSTETEPKVSNVVQSRSQRLKKFVQLYSWGEDGVAWRVLNANCDVTKQKRAKGGAMSFLRKESNECMACLVSMKSIFNFAAFSSKPPPGRF